MHVPLLCLALVACRAPVEVPPGEPPPAKLDAATAPRVVCPETSTAMQQETFARRCASAECHDRDNPALALDLVSPGLEQRLIDVPSRGCRGERLVVAGQPEQSELFRKVAHSQPECGLRMPVATPFYSDEEIACLAMWIESLRPQGSGGTDGGAGGDAGADAQPDMIVDPGISCPTGQNVCNGVCLDLATSNGNCGTCGRACTAGQVCLAGSCACTTGLTSCSGACVDTSSDANHCGRCGAPCNPGTVCAGGTCVRGGCPSGTTSCGGACVDTRTSALHCGGCNQPCPSGRTCSGGSCACAAGLTTCGSACVNTATDPANCGGCGKPCAAGTSCSNGSCVSSCASGTTLCAGSCVNTATDPRHCGACGRPCAAGEMCLGGACQGCGPTVSFASQVQPIFNAECTTNCHSGNRPAGNLSLASGVAYAEMVNVVSTCGGKKQVAPGSPSTSYLVNKITGMGMCSGGIMPKMGGELTAAQIATIRAWICQGAPNN